MRMNRHRPSLNGDGQLLTADVGAVLVAGLTCADAADAQTVVVGALVAAATRRSQRHLAHT